MRLKVFRDLFGTVLCPCFSTARPAGYDQMKCSSFALPTSWSDHVLLNRAESTCVFRLFSIQRGNLGSVNLSCYPTGWLGYPASALGKALSLAVMRAPFSRNQHVVLDLWNLFVLNFSSVFWKLLTLAKILHSLWVKVPAWLKLIIGQVFLHQWSVMLYIHFVSPDFVYEW